MSCVTVLFFTLARGGQTFSSNNFSFANVLLSLLSLSSLIQVGNEAKKRAVGYGDALDL